MGDRSKYNATYNAKHKAQISAKGKAWYAEHRAEVSARRRERLERLKVENPEEYERVMETNRQRALRWKSKRDSEKKETLAASTRVCVVCGKEYAPVRTNQACCTVECSRVRMRKVRVKRETKRCEFCGEEFVGTPRQKYCSPKCYSDASNAKAKDKYTERRQNISIVRVRTTERTECAPQVGPVDKAYDERMAWRVVYTDDPAAKFALFKTLTARQQRLVAQFDRQRHRGAHSPCDIFTK